MPCCHAETSRMTPTTEYTEMKAFLRFFSERFLDQRVTAPSARPMAVLDALEQESQARASSGLRMAVNNCMEISAPWPLSQVKSLDIEMHAKGLLTLSQVRHRVWGRYAAILKRGQIRSPAEYVAAQGVLSDPALALSLPEPERLSLQAMVRAWGGA